MLYTNTIERGTLELLKNISSNPVFSNFYLAGGTALALQVGHRKSIDLGFFCTAAFDVTAISEALEHEYHALLINQYPNTILTEISGVKVDIISHQYKNLEKTSIIDEIRLAGKMDIAAMKLNALKNRGSKKDFIDIFFLLKEYNLKQLIEFHNIKYPNHNELLILKSLTYFADADVEPELLMLKSCNWEEVKNDISNHVNQYVREI